MADGIVFAMTFAEELMKCFYGNMGISWHPQKGIDRIFPMFSARDRSYDIAMIAAAMEEIIVRNMDDIGGCHWDLVLGHHDNRHGFGYYAIKAAPSYFPNGYCPEGMLAFFTMVGGVCRLCHKKDRKDNEVLDSAAQVIGMVLSAHTLTREFDLDVHDRLVQVAKKIVRTLAPNLKVQIVHPTNNNDSGSD